MRTPPAWFVQKLKAINHHFDVKWHEGRRRWAILEGVRRVKAVAALDGAPVFRQRRSPTAALYVTHLGSKLLETVRRNDPRRYRSVEEMAEVLGFDKDEHGRPARTLADSLRRA